MASAVEICNFALSHLGVAKEIASLTEESTEASACNRFYVPSRDATLRDFAWPFATKIATLGLIEEEPTDEWNFSYAYPSDCLALRRLLSGIRNDSRQTRAPYKILRDGAVQVIYTDVEDAEAEYTYKVTDPGQFPYDFAQALAWRLATYLAPRLSKGDPFRLGSRASQMYEYELAKARANAGNEEQAEEPPDSEFIRERG